VLNTNVYTCGYVGCLKKKLSLKWSCYILYLIGCVKKLENRKGCGIKSPNIFKLKIFNQKFWVVKNFEKYFSKPSPTIAI